MKRSPLNRRKGLRSSPFKRTGATKRGTPIRRAKRIKPVSDKRRAENELRAATRHLVMAKNGGRCMFPGCRSTECDDHEIKKRSQGGSITDVANRIPLCRLCHEWVEKHPREAAEMGLSYSKKWSKA